MFYPVQFLLYFIIILFSGVEWCNLWHLAWQPLLQGIARLCTDNRKQVSFYFSSFICKNVGYF